MCIAKAESSLSTNGVKCIEAAVLDGSVAATELNEN
jgi:hypothetical protein